MVTPGEDPLVSRLDRARTGHSLTPRLGHSQRTGGCGVGANTSRFSVTLTPANVNLKDRPDVRDAMRLTLLPSSRIRSSALALLLSGSLVAGGGCTGNAAADGGLLGAAAGAATFIGLKAAGVDTGAAAGIAAGVGVAAGVVTFFAADAKYKKEASEAEEARARAEAQRVAEQDRQAGKQRSEDYYVPVSQQNGEVGLQKIDHTTNQPASDEVIVYSEKDLQDAQANGQTVKIDGHELAGRI